MSKHVYSNPDIIFISLDATRYDYLFERPLSNQLGILRDLRETSHFFTNAYATSPWTPPSHASMFTGHLPSVHGVREGSLWLSDEKKTIAGYLKTKGYHTIGISSNPLLGPITNLNKDFHEFFELWKNPTQHKQASEYLRFDNIILDSRTVFNELEKILAHVAKHSVSEPLFLFIQLIGPHNPFTPTNQAKEKFVGIYPDAVWDRVTEINRDWRSFYCCSRNISDAESSLLRDLYQAELWDMDQGLKRLFDYEPLQSMLDHSHVIITADHGEMLGEKRHIHHLFNLYEPVIHVPMLWKTPEQRMGIIHNKLFQHDMILPMVESLNEQNSFDEALAKHQHDQAIAALMKPEEILQGLNRISPEAAQNFAFDQVAVVRDGLKLIWRSDNEHEGFKLDQDPEEENNLYEKEPELFEAHLNDVVTYLNAQPENDIQGLMKNLGYF